MRVRARSEESQRRGAARRHATTNFGRLAQAGHDRNSRKRRLRQVFRSAVTHVGIELRLRPLTCAPICAARISCATRRRFGDQPAAAHQSARATCGRRQYDHHLSEHAGQVREYQQLVVRSFLLATADAKVVANTIRTIVKSRDVIVDEKLNMVIVRDSPERSAWPSAWSTCTMRRSRR